MKRTKTSKNKNPESVKKAKPSITKKNNLILLALIISLLNIIFTSLISVPSEEILSNYKINNSSVYLIFILFSVVLFGGIYMQKIKFLSYTFFLLLIFSISINFIPQSLYQDPENSIYIKLKIFQSVLIFTTIFFGIVTVWFNTEKINKTISSLYKNEESRFKLKFLTSKNEIVYTILFVIVVGFSIYTNFHRLDRFDLYSDEAQVTQGAAGYMYSGEFRQYSFSTKKINTTKYYNRAKPHQYVLAKTYEFLGISTWSSRFPSALFGVLLIIVGYIISRYFLKDKFAAILIILSFAFSYEFLLLQRWARMYAMLMPVFLIAFYFGYRFMSEKNNLSFIKSEKRSFITNILNYNYLMLPVFLLFFWLSFKLHMNSVILLLIFFLFSLLTIPLTKEKKYTFITILGLLIIASQFIFPFNLGYRWLTLFEVNNFEYYKYAFLGFPFSYETNIVFIVIVTFALIISKNKQFVKNYLALISVVISGLILFSFVIDFSISFRYMSFMASLAIMLTIGAIMLIIKSLFNKYLYYFIGLLIIGSVLAGFQSKYEDLYVSNKVSPATPSKAWKIITDNYTNDELLMKHWGPSIYLNEIDTNPQIQSLYKFRKQSFETILDTLQNYKSGWLTWHTQNSGHIHKDLIDYANLYYLKHHGYGIDKTGVEVFSYNDSLQRPLDIFNFDKNIPSANLKTDKTYTVCFTLEISDFTLGQPFYIKTINGKDITQFSIGKGHNLKLKYNLENDSISVQLPVNKQSHIIWYQEEKNNEITYGIYLNGKLIKSKLLKNNISNLVKFKVNPLFNGIINDIRIYDFILSEKQIKKVIKSIGIIGSEEMIVNKEKFRTLYYWLRK